MSIYKKDIEKESTKIISIIDLMLVCTLDHKLFPKTVCIFYISYFCCSTNKIQDIIYYYILKRIRYNHS